MGSLTLKVQNDSLIECHNGCFRYLFDGTEKTSTLVTDTIVTTLRCEGAKVRTVLTVALYHHAGSDHADQTVVLVKRRR